VQRGVQSPTPGMVQGAHYAPAESFSAGRAAAPAPNAQLTGRLRPVLGERSQVLQAAVQGAQSALGTSRHPAGGDWGPQPAVPRGAGVPGGQHPGAAVIQSSLPQAQSMRWPVAGNPGHPGAFPQAANAQAMGSNSYQVRSRSGVAGTVHGWMTTGADASAFSSVPSQRDPWTANGGQQPLTSPGQSTSPPSGASKLSPSDVPRPAGIDRDYIDRSRPVLVCRHEYGRGTQAETPSLSPSFREAVDTFQIDRGNARPRYVRWTVGSVPRTPDLARSSGIPLAVYVAPFADATDEKPPPVIDTRPHGPVRCSRCQAYLNVGIRYVDSGRSFICNLCHHLNAVDVDRFVPLDPVTQLPVDFANRLELSHGSVEYIVPEEVYGHQGRTSEPVFVLVADAPSLGSLLPYAAFRELLAESLALHRARLALIVTSAGCLHLFPIQPSGSVQEIILPDIQEPFLPVPPTQLLQSPDLEYWPAIAEYIQRTDWYTTAESESPGSHIFAGVLAAAELLEDPSIGGGKILAISSGLSLGPHRAGLALRNRWLELDTRSSHQKWKSSMDRERWLLQPANDAFAALGKRLADAQITLDLFLHPGMFPGTATPRPLPYFDLATLRTLTEHCGGKLFYYQQGRDVAGLQRDLIHAIRAVRALEAVLRVRCSPGITTGEHLGSFRPPGTDRPDIYIPVMSTSTNLYVAIRHDLSEGIVTHPLLHQRSGTGDDAEASAAEAHASTAADSAVSPCVCVQVAVLFTHPGDRTRRVRVHTLAAPCTTLLGQLFRTLDVTCLMGWLARSAAARVQAGGLLPKLRDHLTEQLVDMLFVYRRYCASRSSPGQLILPEALKLGPIYTLGLLKSAAFRAEQVAPDERAYRLHQFMASSLLSMQAAMHPLMFDALNSTVLDPMVGTPIPGTGVVSREATGVPSPSLVSWNSPAGPRAIAAPPSAATSETDAQLAAAPDGAAKLPPLQALTSERLGPDSAWLLFDGWHCLLWIGEFVNPDQQQSVPGVYAGLAGLPVPVMERLYALFPGLLSPDMVSQRSPAEQTFMQLLIEDRMSYAPSYIEYLVTLHKLVQRKLASNEAEKQHRMLGEWEWAHTY
jgi:hypothetical protein